MFWVKVNSLDNVSEWLSKNAITWVNIIGKSDADNLDVPV